MIAPWAAILASIAKRQANATRAPQPPPVELQPEPTPNARQSSGFVEREAFLFRAKGINKTKLSAAIKRKIPGEYGHKRSRLNVILAKPDNAAEVMPLAEALVKSVNYNPRNNACWCIELLLSLPSIHCLPEQAYFASCLKWTADRFGAGNILTADIHNDQVNPHMHVLVLPLRDGKLQGSAILGGRSSLYATRADFESKVRNRY